MGRALYNNGVHGRVAEMKILQKEHCCSLHVDRLMLENVLRTHKTEVEHFGLKR